MTYITVSPFTFNWYAIISIFAVSLVLVLMLGSFVTWKTRSRIASFMGFYLIFDLFFLMAYLRYYNAFSIEASLPLTFCSIMQLFAGLAGITKKSFFFEMSLFFGILGPMQAFVTPAIVYAGEEYLLYDFFISHGLTIMVPLFMAVCMGFTPSRGAVFKALTVMQLIVAFVYFVNVNLDSNYMYLLYKPPVAHPLNDGPHGHNVILWHLYFYAAAFLINGLFYLIKVLDDMTTGKIK